MASSGIVAALVESKTRVRQLIAPIKTSLKEISTLVSQIKKKKAMKTCQAQLKAVTRNAESLTETASVFKVATSENQAVLQSAAETVGICLEFMKKCHTRLNGKPLSAKDRRDAWTEFLHRKYDPATDVNSDKLAVSIKPRRLSTRGDGKMDEDAKRFEAIGQMAQDITSRYNTLGGGGTTRILDEFKPRVDSVKPSDPLNPHLFVLTLDSNLAGFKSVEFEIDVKTDSIDAIANDFANDFSEMVEKKSLNEIKVMVSGCLKSSLASPPGYLSPYSEDGVAVLAHKLSTLSQLLHFAEHELALTSLVEVQSLMGTRIIDGKNNPFLTKRKPLPMPKPLPKPASQDKNIPLKRLPVQLAFRHGDIQPSESYMAEIRQVDWENLQKRWWTNDSDVLPHILVVSGAAGVGKTDYARFVAGTVTHLIPNYTPSFHVQYSFSPALSGLNHYLDILCSGNAVDWRRGVIRRITEEVELALRSMLLPSQVAAKSQEEIGRIFQRLFHRRSGVIILDDFPSDKIPQLLKSSIWPKDPSSKCVLIVTTRRTPADLPKNVICQHLDGFTNAQVQSLMLNLAGYDRDAVATPEPNSIDHALSLLAPATGGSALGARVLGGFATWTSKLRTSSVQNEAKVVSQMAQTLQTEPTNDEERALSKLNLDSFALPKGATTARRGFSAAVADIALVENDDDKTPTHTAKCLSYVFARLPRLARGVFRSLFVFAGPFSCEMVANALQASDHRAVQEGLQILITTGFVNIAAELNGFLDEKGDKDDKKQRKGRGAATSRSYTARDARSAIKRTLERERYQLSSTAWKFCFLLNRFRKMPSKAKGSSVAAANQRNWLLELSRNYIGQTQRLWRNLKAAFYGGFEPDSISELSLARSLLGNGEALTSEHLLAREVASLHIPNLLAASALALTISKDPVTVQAGPGLSLLGLCEDNEEIEVEERESHESDSSEDLDTLGDARLAFFAPNDLTNLILSPKIRRALYSGYVRLNVTSASSEKVLGLEGKGGDNPVEELKETIALESMDTKQRAIVTLAARRAWGWLAMARAYEEHAKPAEGFDSFWAAFRQLMYLRVIKFPSEKATINFAKWHLRCIVGLCKMSEKAKGIQLAIRYWEMGMQLIQPLATQRRLLTQKFTMSRAANRNLRIRRGPATNFWRALLLLKILAIRIHTKMGAFQNAVDLSIEAKKIVKALPEDASQMLCECELSVGDTYLRLGMWEEAKKSFQHAYIVSVRQHMNPWATKVRARALTGRADAARKSGSFYEFSRDAQELQGLLYESDEPLLPPNEISKVKRESISVSS
ncbi:hypothetical protein AAMO2058_000615600 [Amorphochlora amoebiformis]